MPDLSSVARRAEEDVGRIPGVEERGDWSLVMGHSPLRGVVFDFDGTLGQLTIDFNEMRRRVAQVVESCDASPGLPDDRPILEGLAWVAEQVRTRGADPAPILRRAEDAMREIELEAAARATLLPGVAETLGQLRAMGVRVGIITRNCEAAVRQVWPDISHCCDCFLPRDRVTEVKPSPGHLTACLGHLGVEPESALMVGDHPMDIQAGRAAGMATVGVLTGHSTRQRLEEAGADRIVASVRDVTGILTASSSESLGVGEE